MCGIGGYSDNIKIDINLLNQMGILLSHRGPDNNDLYLRNNIGLVHTRLSIIDLNERSNQPLIDATGKYIIVFNGEIYNFKKLKIELETRGITFKTNGDTEIILEGYKLFGIDFFDKLIGFYSFCIYDVHKNELIFSRDRFGKKPLYFYEKNKKLIFCSEINPILKALDHTPEVNYEKLSHYLWKGYFANGDTAYKHILSFLPGETAIYKKDSFLLLRNVRHLGVKLNIDNKYSSRNLCEVESQINEAIQKRQISDVPIKYLLSGGIDSSLISLLASQNSKNEIDTYFLKYSDTEDIFEDIANKVASLINSRHNVIGMQPPKNFNDAVCLMVDIFNEPFADYSALPSYELYKVISHYSKVVISGDGADEIFGGYIDTKLFYLKNKFNCLALQSNSKKLVNFIYKLVSSPKKINRLTGYFLGCAFCDDKNLMLSIHRNGWNNSYRENYMSSEGYLLTRKDEIENNEMIDFENSGKNPLERYFNYNMKRLSYDFLVKVDRTSMANSLEVRSPYLDTSMFNHLNKFKPSNVVDLYNTKKELKKILLKSKINFISKARKKGFTPPLENWMLNMNPKTIRDKLILSNDSIISALFDLNKVGSLISNKKSILQNSIRIWHLLILENWHKKLYR